MCHTWVCQGGSQEDTPHVATGSHAHLVKGLFKQHSGVSSLPEQARRTKPAVVSWTDFPVWTSSEFDLFCLSPLWLLGLISGLFLLLLVPYRRVYIYTESGDNLPGTGVLTQRDTSSSLDFLFQITWNRFSSSGL